MEKQEIFETVCEIIMEVLPGVSRGDIRIDSQLRDLGANSIDRMEVVTMSMERLGLRMPLMSFAQVSNIEGLVDVLAERHDGGAH